MKYETWYDTAIEFPGWPGQLICSGASLSSHRLVHFLNPNNVGLFGHRTPAYYWADASFDIFDCLLMQLCILNLRCRHEGQWGGLSKEMVGKESSRQKDWYGERTVSASYQRAAVLRTA